MALTVSVASAFGMPISTTHCIESQGDWAFGRLGQNWAQFVLEVVWTGGGMDCRWYGLEVV